MCDGILLIVLMTDGYGYLVYPWVNAKALDKNEINEVQALIIARILAKMHLINFCIEDIDEPEFAIHDNKHIANLIKQSNQMRLPFADILNSHLSTLLAINESYLGSIEILKKHTVIGHGDLDQKNVLWTENKEPLFIDWESARKLNPTYEIVNAALDWSGVTTNLKINLFHKNRSINQIELEKKYWDRAIRSSITNNFNSKNFDARINKLDNIMIKIDLLKNHSDAIPELAHIWHDVLGRIWCPDLTIQEIESLTYDELNTQMKQLHSLRCMMKFQ